MTCADNLEKTGSEDEDGNCVMARGAVARYPHVALNRRKERLQPFIRGGIRKISCENLVK